MMGSVPDRLPTLKDGELTLRQLEADDLDRLMAIIETPGVREWWGFMEDREHEREGLLNDGSAFGIEVDGELAGWLCVSQENEPDFRHAGLDIFLAREHQGRGLGPRALRLAARWLIGERGHHRLTIDPARRNARAISAYESLGFKPVGVLRRYERGADGEWHDGLLMDLLADELV